MTEEFKEDWECFYCEAPLGEHPRGVEVVCPTCGKLNIMPGFDNRHQSEGTVKFLARLKERAKKQNQERYKAMRER